MGLTVSKGLAAENYLEDLDEEEAWEAQETPNLEILPEEIILFIFSFLEASSLGTVGLLNRKLRKISSDELLWKPLFKAKWGVCPIRELLRGQFHWRDEFMQRQAFVHRRRKRMNEDPGTFWSRLSSSLGTWGQRKHKIVFVGLEAAGKTTCCYRLQTSDPEPNIVPSLQCFPPMDVFQTRELECVCWDLGGYKSSFYNNYSNRVFLPRLAESDAIVFVIDASEDNIRMEEARKELISILETKLEADFDKSLNLFEKERVFPVLLLANKQDLSSSKSAKEVEAFFAPCFQKYTNVVWLCRGSSAVLKRDECLFDAVAALMYEIDHNKLEVSPD
jgi:ADP-ribosylation factor protein 1